MKRPVQKRGPNAHNLIVGEEVVRRIDKRINEEIVLKKKSQTYLRNRASSQEILGAENKKEKDGARAKQERTQVNHYI